MEKEQNFIQVKYRNKDIIKTIYLTIEDKDLKLYIEKYLILSKDIKLTQLSCYNMNYFAIFLQKLIDKIANYPSKISSNVINIETKNQEKYYMFIEDIYYLGKNKFILCEKLLLIISEFKIKFEKSIENSHQN